MNRFNETVVKLYNAFHKETLNAFDCSACAVGTICGHGGWHGYFSDSVYIGRFNINSNSFGNYPANTPYSRKELQRIEYHFLRAWNKDWEGEEPTGKEKDFQFQGLCNVIEYLAELDGLENPFDLEKLFSNDSVTSEQELQKAN